MRGRKPSPLVLDAACEAALVAFVARHTTPQQLALRARIVLLAAQGQNNKQIATQLAIKVDTARLWRERWLTLAQQPLSTLPVHKRLADAPRPGAPARIAAEALCQIMALACRPPAEVGRPIVEWTPRELAQEAVGQGLVQSISPRQVGRFLKRDGHQAPSEPLLADTRPRS